MALSISGGGTPGASEVEGDTAEQRLTQLGGLAAALGEPPAVRLHVEKVVSTRTRRRWMRAGNGVAVRRRCGVRCARDAPRTAIARRAPTTSWTKR